MKRIIFIGFLLSTVLLFISCETSINEYKPKNEKEKQIIALLNTFVDSCNNGDLKRLQDTFHDGGIYNSVRGGQVTKSEITQKDPEWFTVAGKIELKNPEFEINGNLATILVTARHGNHYKGASLFTLVKEDNQWLIMKVE
jgi:hypothetical protein